MNHLNYHNLCIRRRRYFCIIKWYIIFVKKHFLSTLENVQNISIENSGKTTPYAITFFFFRLYI